MIKIRYWAILLFMISSLTACASLPRTASPDPDSITHSFLSALKSKNLPAAYNLFAAGLSYQLSFENFNELIKNMTDKLGPIIEYESVEMPFHFRSGESNFIPLDIKPEDIKRYVFELRFKYSTLYCDLTVVPQNESLKIVWLSFWGGDRKLK